jgi:hypothetical protein
MRRRSFLGALLAGVCAPAAVRAEEPVDLQLVLAIDSSSSVSMDEYYLQLDGYAAAFRHPNLLKAIRSGTHQAIAVMLFEWSGETQQTVNFEWRRLADEAGVAAFANELQNAPRLVTGGQTAIGEAIDFATRRFADCPFEGRRRVIDISGDGSSNRGRRVTMARDDAVLQGFTINGLPVLHEEPELDTYYQRFVVGGVGAFVISARDYTDFAEAILKKLLHEIEVVAELPVHRS